MKTIYHTRSYRTRNQCSTFRKFIKKEQDKIFIQLQIVQTFLK